MSETKQEVWVHLESRLAVPGINVASAYFISGRNMLITTPELKSLLSQANTAT
jgi:hypothetical protein